MYLSDKAPPLVKPILLINAANDPSTTTAHSFEVLEF